MNISAPQNPTPTRREINGFIIRTMLVSVVVTSVISGLIAGLLSHSASIAIATSATIIFGAIFVAPVMLIVWGWPSVGIFRWVSRKCHSLQYRHSLIVSAFVTTLVAATFLVILTSQSRDIAGFTKLAALAGLFSSVFTVRSSFPSAFSQHSDS
jgi:hypothetical protein